jgi:sortase A
MKMKLNGVKNFVKGNKKTVVIGIFVMGYILFWLWYFGEKNVSLVENLVVNDNQEQAIEEKKISKKQIKKEFTEADLGNFWLEINTQDIKVKAPIINGIEDSDLNKGLGRHKTMSLPGEKGNMVISGHRWKFGSNPAYKVFEDLNKFENGDMVKVHYGNKVFEYEIYENGTVKQNEEGVEEILKRVDKSILTLYTCTPKRTALKRLYYRARLVE